MRDIVEKVIPFFKKYILHEVKAKDFAVLCEVGRDDEGVKYFTPEGLYNIKQIKVIMNTGRSIS